MFLASLSTYKWGTYSVYSIPVPTVCKCNWNNKQSVIWFGSIIDFDIEVSSMLSIDHFQAGIYLLNLV